MTKINLIVASMIATLLVFSSCKKQNVTTFGKTNSTNVNSDSTKQVAALTPVSLIYKTTIITLKDSYGNHPIRITNYNGVYLYDIDNDGIVDYQVVPKTTTDFSKLTCYGTDGKLYGELSLNVNANNVGYISKIPVDLNPNTSQIIKYTDRSKSFFQWKTCVSDFTGSYWGIGIATLANFGGAWGGVVYAGGIGIGCYLATVIKNYRINNSPLICLSTYTTYSSTVSGNVVTPINNTTSYGDISKGNINPFINNSKNY